MKIGITGTHGVGKTSLAHSLCGELKEKGIHAVVSSEHERQSPFPAGTESRNSVEAQCWILGKQFLEEIELSSRYPVVICDRTMLCNYAYFLWNLEKAPPEMQNNPMVAVIKNMVREWLKTYTYFFRIPISDQKTLMEDKFRSTTTDWQREIDKIIDKAVEEFSIHQIVVPLATNTKRVDQILRVVGKDIGLEPQQV